MARGRLFAALAVIALLSTGAAHASDSEERALRDQLADRDEYRAKLILELQRRESLLAQQQQELATQEQRLRDLYAKLSAPVSDDEESNQPTQISSPNAKGAAGQKLRPDTPTTIRAKDFETQTYKVQVARYNVARTRKDIDELKKLLARHL
jgi:hypothetical protein